MDQDTLEQRIKAAREAGYSDEEINATLGRNVASVPSKIEAAPDVPVLSAEDRARLQREEAAETTRREEVATPGEVATLAGAAPAAGGAILSTAKEMVGPAAMAYSAYKAGQVANKFMKGMGGATPPGQAPIGSPANPIGGNAPRPVVPSTTAPGPVNPATMPQPMAQPAPQATQPSMLDKTTNMIRQLAANKVFQGLAKGGAFVAGIATPGNVGQNYMVPQTGRMRGMEINPMTGRPWTQDQLRMYEANPAQFDTALGAAQMPR